MDTQPSVDLVVEAIKSLYNNPNPTLKEEAGRYGVLRWLQHKYFLWKSLVAKLTLTTNIGGCNPKTNL